MHRNYKDYSEWMTKSSKEYEAEIATLKSEIQRLQEKKQSKWAEIRDSTPARKETIQVG